MPEGLLSRETKLRHDKRPLTDIVLVETRYSPAADFFCCSPGLHARLTKVLSEALLSGDYWAKALTTDQKRET